MYSIIDFGAQVNCLSTKAIQQAVDCCSKNGGGMVYCPPGIFLTGTIWLKDNVNLHLESGCRLMASPDLGEYNAIDCFDLVEEHDYIPHQNTDGTHMIIAYKMRNVSITGQGKISGNCSEFFKEGKHEHPNFPGFYMYNLPEKRPAQLLYFYRSSKITIRDVAINDASFWTVYMLGCEHIKISGISIKVLEVPNGDGLHFSCCSNLVISDCDIESQDDCLIFRGHYKPLGENIPCENVTVSNCLLKTFCCAFRIGVGDGVVRNCSFSNIVIHNTRQGINFMPAYSERYPRGTDIDNVNFSNITMDVMIPIYFSNAGDADLRNISFSNLNVRMTQTSIIHGEKENPIKNLSVRNSSFFVKAGNRQSLGGGGMYMEVPDCSMYIGNTSGVQLNNCSFKYDEESLRPEQVIYQVNNNDLKVV